MNVAVFSSFFLLLECVAGLLLATRLFLQDSMQRKYKVKRVSVEVNT